MSVAYPISIFAIIIYLGTIALILIITFLLIWALILSIRALKKYLQS